MKNVPIMLFEFFITGLMLFLGLSGRKFLFIKDARSSLIAFGIILMLFCTFSVGKFISAAPYHPLTILAYLFGALAMAAFLTQTFRWKLPVLRDPKTALILFAVAVIAKSVIARFYPLLIEHQ